MINMFRFLLLAVAAIVLSGAAPQRHERTADREMMVLTIENIAATNEVAGRDRIDRSVLMAMRKVPRHLLVPEQVRSLAYSNSALPIGHEATISQPYIVALMTDLLDVKKDHVVLEVGTGSGYQAAVLSHLARHVYTIEIIEPLAAQAAAQLKELGYDNITVRAGDGYAGWREHAPFDRIIVTAGASHIPKPLIDQLKPGGRMVIPVGKSSDRLQLTLVTKSNSGKVRTTSLLPVSFVPLTRRKD